jgi:hypothetical protein
MPDEAVRLSVGPSMGILRHMKTPVPNRSSLLGRVPLLLLWLIGIPVPILILIFLFRGCAG